VSDARISEEIREVVPQAQLCVVAVGMLKALDRRDRFDARGQRFETINAPLEGGQPRVRALCACPERSGRADGHDEGREERYGRERALNHRDGPDSNAEVSCGAACGLNQLCEREGIR
jgi:hypothetical protein